MSVVTNRDGVIAAKRLLTIDDSVDIGELIAVVAEPIGYACIHATSFAAFTELLGDDTDVIVVDLMMPDIDGIEVLRYLAGRQCAAAVLLLSGADRRLLSVAEEMARASGLRVMGSLPKPFLPRELEGMLRTQTGVAASKSPRSSNAPLITVDELQCAIAEHQFVLHYQPQVDIRSRAVVGAEILVRWQHPLHGLLFPDLFVGVSEASGMANDLTWLVMDGAFADAARFAVSGWNPTLSINVSATFLRDLDLPEKLFAHAAAAGVLPANITIEITESGAIEKVAAVLDIVARLRLRGFRLSIDDFGTGFSMMQQLKRIPANELKIDKEFVRVMGSDHDARVIVSKTIEIGHALGMTVVAEGVETDEQLRMLEELHCDLAQGYLFARPMPAENLLAWQAVFSSRT